MKPSTASARSLPWPGTPRPEARPWCPWSRRENTVRCGRPAAPSYPHVLSGSCTPCMARADVRAYRPVTEGIPRQGGLKRPVPSLTTSHTTSHPPPEPLNPPGGVPWEMRCGHRTLTMNLSTACFPPAQPLGTSSWHGQEVSPPLHLLLRHLLLRWGSRRAGEHTDGTDVLINV